MQLTADRARLLRLPPAAGPLLAAGAATALHVVAEFAGALPGLIALLPLCAALGWTAVVLGARAAAPAVAAAVVSTAQEVAAGQALEAALELAILTALSPLAAVAAYGIRAEASANERMRAHVGGRVSRLKAEPGYWHEVATTRVGSYVTRIEAEFIAEALSGAPPGAVMDIGAGSGRLEFALAPHARVVVATDIDEDEVRRMEDDYRVSPVIVGQYETLPAADGSLDWVVAIEVPAASDEDWFLAECSRVVKAGGGAVVMVYNAASFKGFVARVLARRRRAKGVSWAELYYRHGLEQQIARWRAAGFSAVRGTGFYWLPFGRSSNSALVPAASFFERVLGLRRVMSLSPWVLLELRKAPGPRSDDVTA